MAAIKALPSPTCLRVFPRASTENFLNPLIYSESLYNSPPVLTSTKSSPLYLSPSPWTWPLVLETNLASGVWMGRVHFPCFCVSFTAITPWCIWTQIIPTGTVHTGCNNLSKRCWDGKFRPNLIMGNWRLRSACARERGRGIQQEVSWMTSLHRSHSKILSGTQTGS